MQYLIHTIPSREWYVDEFLIPSLHSQCIEADKYIDSLMIGNLQATLESYKILPQDGYTCHLQDDVIISKDFSDVISRLSDYDIACGFQSIYDNSGTKVGIVDVQNMWYSFPCIIMPNQYAHEFVKWVEDRRDDTNYIQYIQENKHDDLLFRCFVSQEHSNARIINIHPNIVDHIDYMIGGSVVNADRGDKIVHSKSFNIQTLEDTYLQLKKYVI